MPSMPLSDLAATASLRRQSARLNAEVQIRSNEMTTGRHADVAQANRGDMRPLAAVTASIKRIDSLKPVINETQVWAETMQVAIGRIDSEAGRLGPELLGKTSAGEQPSTDVSLAAAARAFEDMVATLNTRIGDRSVFAGTRPDLAAVRPAPDILDELEAVVAGATSAAEVASLVRDWFADPAGYATFAYLGGDPVGAIPVTAQASIRIAITALAPALTETLAGLAIAALSERSIGPGTLDFRAGLAEEAGQTLMAAEMPRAQLAAGLGAVEARLTELETEATAERNALAIAQNDLIGVDAYDATILLQTAQTQLEALYEVTARIQRLSLVNYL